MPVQLCNTTSTVSGTVTITEQSCTAPASGSIDYYWAFIITLALFLGAWLTGKHIGYKK